MAETNPARSHWFPKVEPGKRPSAWWYWGRAVYVSRRDYWKITKVFLGVGVPLGVIGVVLRQPWAFWSAISLAEIGLLLLTYSLFGLYRMYGHPAQRYVQKLAAYVDEKMSAIADVTTTVDTQKVAVLAALAIADELHTIRKDRGEEEELLREQAERCLTLVERALKQTA